MKIQTHKSTTLFSAITVALLVLITIFITVNHSASATDGQNVRVGHLITIHDRGEQKVVLSRGATIGDAIKEAGVTLDKNDAVEPVVDQQMVASEYQVNIYHARQVIVVDGAIRQKVITPYQTGEQIAKSAGVILYPEDTTTIVRTDDIVAEGAGLTLTIDRATPVVFNLYGKPTTIRTHATTVAGLLKDKAIVLGKDDTLSVPLTQSVNSGMSIELWRNGKQTVNVDEDITFDTQKIQDANQPVGYRQVTTAGVVGKKTVTYEVDMKNGLEIGRTQIQSVATLQPLKQVEVIGAKTSLPPGSHEDWMAAAGISEGDYGYVNYIVSREGGWCPYRWQGDPSCTNHGTVTPGGMGYGLVQATPGTKMANAGDDWLTNPITQLRWASGYAIGRYGGWQAAYNHWLSSHNW